MAFEHFPGADLGQEKVHVHSDCAVKVPMCFALDRGRPLGPAEYFERTRPAAGDVLEDQFDFDHKKEPGPGAMQAAAVYGPTAASLPRPGQMTLIPPQTPSQVFFAIFVDAILVGKEPPPELL